MPFPLPRQVEVVYAIICTTNAYSYDPQAVSPENSRKRARKIRRTLAVFIGVASILRALFAFIAFWVGADSVGLNFVLGNLILTIGGIGIAAKGSYKVTLRYQFDPAMVVTAAQQPKEDWGAPGTPESYPKREILPNTPNIDVSSNVWTVYLTD